MNHRYIRNAARQNSAATSSLVRRLIYASDDPAKQRVRAWLSAISDDKLLSFGLSPEDIELLRASTPQSGRLTATRTRKQAK
jgi:hypothetical protein